MPDASQPTTVKKLRGVVLRAITGRGSKSEREAYVFDTNRGRFILRRKGGPAYGDAALERYIDRHVECDGFLLGSTLLAETITELA